MRQAVRRVARLFRLGFGALAVLGALTLFAVAFYCTVRHAPVAPEQLWGVLLVGLSSLASVFLSVLALIVEAAADGDL